MISIEYILNNSCSYFTGTHKRTILHYDVLGKIDCGAFNDVMIFQPY